MSNPAATSTIPNNPMGYAPINSLLLKLGIPMMISMLVQALYNVVDSIFVSFVSEDALSAVGLAFPAQNLMISFGVGTAVGVNALLSKSLGEKEFERASRAAGNGLFLSAVTCAAFVLFGLFGVDAFIGSQTTDPVIHQYGVEYLTICSVFSAGLFCQTMCEKLLVATGRSSLAMTSQLVGAVANIVLDPIFIFGLNMGVRGAALATIISQAVSMVWILKFLTGKKTTIRIRLRYLRPKWSVLLPSLALGLSPFIMMATESLIAVCFNTSLRKYGGDLAVGAMTILSSVMQFSMLPLQGLTQGAQPIISYNYGAGNADRVRHAFKLLVTCTTTFSVALWLAVQLAPDVFIMIFNDAPNLVEVARPALRIYTAAVCLLGAQIGCQQTFVAIGNAKSSLFLALLRKVFLLIPLIYLLPNVLPFEKTTCVFLAEPVADILAVATTVTMFTIQFRRAMRRLDRTV